MPRPMVTLTIFFLAFNLFSGMIMGTGVGAMLGIDANVGGDGDIDESLNESKEISTGAPTGSTLFGMYNVLAGALNTLLAPVTAGPQMLKQAGTPTALVNMIQGLIVTVYAIGIISFLRGFDL